MNQSKTEKLNVILIVVVIVLVVIIVGGVCFFLGKGSQTAPTKKEVSEEKNPQESTATPEVTPTMEPTPTPVPTLSPDEKNYQKAKELYAKKKYGQAAKLFKKLKGYKKSKSYLYKSQIKDFQTKKCKMGGWYNSTPNTYGDGFRYTVTWSKVSGADGYEVITGGKDFDTGWYDDTTYTKQRSKSLEFSSLVQLRAKVRPYKNVKGNRVYGKWSSYCYKSL